MLLYLITPRTLFEKALESGFLKQTDPFILYNKNSILQAIQDKITSKNYEDFLLLVISTKKLHTELKKNNNAYYLAKKIPIEFFEDILEFDFINNELFIFKSSGKVEKLSTFFS